MFTILGAGGAIGVELLKQLAGRKVRLVSRNPKPAQGAEVVAADISEPQQTMAAVSGSTVVYLLAGLKYDLTVWKTLWPRIMRNTIEACKRTGAKLIFFDNVYMYGKVDGWMTEATPFRPSSGKGEIRARIATDLLNEIQAGALTALIARAPDFYGPDARNSVPNRLVFDKLAKGGRPLWLVDDSVPHSYTFTPDAARSLILLADDDRAWNQTWHVPTARYSTAGAPTGKEFIEMAAREFAREPRYRVLNRPMLKLAGLFDPDIRASYEMLYQSESPYLFDSTKFNQTFQFEPQPYAGGIHLTREAYRRLG